MQHQPSCYHCGDPCPSEHITIEEKHFCCLGCQTVYEVLTGNGLDTYYQLNAQPGSSPSNTDSQDYDFLLDSRIAEKLIRFQDEKQVHIAFRIPNIHCASCIWLLENLYKLEAGVFSSEVHFMEKTVRIKYDPQHTDLARIAQRLSDLGYPPHLTLQNFEQEQKAPKDRSFFYRLGIAGFCAGNIMLMSFPEYLGLEATDFQTFFSWIILGLSLPLIGYAAQPFFKSAWMGLRQGQLNIDVPVSIGIFALFAQSLYDILLVQGPGYLDSLAGLIFFLLVGRWFQKVSFDSLSFDRDFKSYFPLVAQVIQGGKTSAVVLSELKAGDTLFVKNGQIIPADALLVEEEAWIDYSFVTGESEPIQKSKHDKVFAGGKAQRKGIKIQLLHTVSESYLTRLWQDKDQAPVASTRLQTITDRLSKNFTFTILSIAVLAGFIWFLKTDLETAVQISIAVLIVACPCGLALSAPIVLGHAVRMLARYGFFLKNSHVLEDFPAIDTLVFDKTGTLTLPHRDNSFDVLHEMSSQDQCLVLAAARESSHPVSKQIQLELAHMSPAPLHHSEEIAGLGVSGKSDKHQVKIGHPSWFHGPEDKAYNAGETAISIDGTLVGMIQRKEQAREGLQPVLDELSRSHQIALLTGDSQARTELLRPLLPPATDVRWKQLPEDKLKYVQSLQRQGRKVMMVGDGLNDAGAFMQAEIGLVVAEELESFSPACEVILDARGFFQLPVYLEYAKKSTQLLKIALWISLVYNLIGLGFAVQGYLSPLVAAILMPLSSISVIVWGIASTWLLAKYLKLRNIQADDKSHFPG